MNELEQQGMIKAFEFTHELAALIPGSYDTLFCDFERRMVELSHAA